MNEFVSRLFAHIPDGYSQDALLVPALSLGGSGSLSVVGDALYITTAGAAQTVDLHSQTVAQIAAQFPKSVTATVLQDGMAELLTVSQGASDTALPATLDLPSNPLWFIVGMMARMLESRKRSLQTQAAQINLQAATTRLLDWWGASVGVGRYTGEPDILYAQRIISLKFRPNVNNTALETFFSTLGYSTVLSDTAPGTFSVNVTLPTSAKNGFYYSTAQLADSLELLKAAGVIATVLLEGSAADTLVFSDSANSTVSDPGTYIWAGLTTSLLGISYLMPASWAWGTGQWRN